MVHERDVGCIQSSKSQVNLETLILVKGSGTCLLTHVCIGQLTGRKIPSGSIWRMIQWAPLLGSTYFLPATFSMSHLVFRYCNFVNLAWRLTCRGLHLNLWCVTLVVMFVLCVECLWCEYEKWNLATNPESIISWTPTEFYTAEGLL